MSDNFMVDWPRLLRAVIDAGLSQEAIASAIGCGQSHISDLLTGRQRQPKFSIGNQLIALYREHVRRPVLRPAAVAAYLVAAQQGRGPGKPRSAGARS